MVKIAPTKDTKKNSKGKCKDPVQWNTRSFVAIPRKSSMEIIPGYMLYSKKIFLKQFGGAKKNSIWGVGGH